mmetsp:Transcript_538/g.2083  ORF Transcript_538/g.2083 Transcript_538/m.2083 type:complete len:232 (+) Transcript_538:225-920(+)
MKFRLRQNWSGLSPRAQLSSSSPAPGTYANDRPSRPTRRSPCHCMGDDALTSTTGVKAKAGFFSFSLESSVSSGKPRAAVSRDTQTHRSGALRVLTSFERSGDTASSRSENKGKSSRIRSRSCSPTHGGNAAPAAEEDASHAEFSSTFVSFRNASGPSARARRLASRTARFSVSAQMGTVLEKLSGKRLVVLRVASTMTHPPRRAAVSATCTLSRVPLKLQLLQWPSVDLK